MKAPIILTILFFSMTLYSQNDIFCSFKKSDYSFSFKNEIKYQLHSQDESNIPIEMNINFGVFVENDSINFSYLFIDMATLGVNPLFQEWNSDKSHKLILTLNNKSKLEIKDLTLSCASEIAPLNKTFSKILFQCTINENDLSRLSSHKIVSIAVTNQNDNMNTIEIPENQADNFKKNMIELIEKIKENKITLNTNGDK